MSIANNIKKLRVQHNLTQAELGEIAGVTDKAVSAWETGSAEPRIGAVQRMSTYFGVTKSSIIEDDNSTANVPLVPLLGRIAAGEEMFACEDVYDWIPFQPSEPGEHFALRVRGDSMAPTIIDGDIIYVRSTPVVQSGEIAVVTINGSEATCKEVRLSTAGITLVGHNPNVYTPHFYTAEEVQTLPVTIRGVVVSMKRDFR